MNICDVVITATEIIVISNSRLICFTRFYFMKI